MGTSTLYFPMGLFNKKKPKKVKETLSINLGNELKKHDAEIESYKRMKQTIHKFTDAYKEQLTNSAYIHGTGITLYLQKQYSNEYPDGFLALADKLGLTIDPSCNSGYYDNGEKSFSIRAKNK